MGLAGQFEHPDYVAALNEIRTACERHKTISGIHVVSVDPSEGKARLAEGYQLLAYSLDITMLATTCQNCLAALRSE